MGDGEVVVVGAEAAGTVRLKAERVDLPNFPTPFLENREVVATIHSHPDLDVAADGAVHNMLTFLTQFVGLSVNDASMLMSAVGSLKVCQIVDPAKTARFEFPQAVLVQLGYELPR